jgi:hypothetical protein
VDLEGLRLALRAQETGIFDGMKLRVDDRRSTAGDDHAGEQ